MVAHNPQMAKESGMSAQQLHDFAATPEKGLPQHVAKKRLEDGQQPYFRWMGHSSGGDTSTFPSGHVSDAGVHRFAQSVDDTPRDHLEDGGGNWIQKAVSKPSFQKGALTAKAHAAGSSPMAFAREHYRSPGKLGAQSRFAVNAQR